MILVPLAPGWERVQELFFDGDAIRARTSRVLLEAFWLDVKIFLWSRRAILVLGLLIAIARNVRSPALFPLRLFATVYTDVVPGRPDHPHDHLIGFGIPGLGARPARGTARCIWGSVALILAYSAYVAEVFRAGIESVHESQRAAARSLGLSQRADDALRRAAPGRCAGSCRR